MDVQLRIDETTGHTRIYKRIAVLVDGEVVDYQLIGADWRPTGFHIVGDPCWDYALMYYIEGEKRGMCANLPNSRLGQELRSFLQASMA